MARVGHADETVAGHLEQTELVGRTEPVLGRAQQPQRVMALTLEREHRVDDVLEHPRPGERALLRDVTDEHDRQLALLGDGHELVRAPAHLHHRTGRRAEQRIVHGLDRVDDDDRRLHLVDGGDDLRQRRLGQQPQVGAHRGEPLGAQAHLLGALLGRDVQRAARASCASSCSSSVLLPMPGSPPSNVTEPGTTPPPSTRSSSPMPVVPGRLASGSTSPISCGDEAGPISGSSRGSATSSIQRVPRPATGALPRPLRVLCAALVADVLDLRACHAASMTGGCGSAVHVRWRRPSRPATLAAVTTGQLIVVAVAIFVAAFVQMLAGFGFALLAMPVMTLAIPVEEAVVIVAILSLATTGVAVDPPPP